MSRPVICDVCNRFCQNARYFELVGWQGKDMHFPGSKRKPDGWTIGLNETIEGLRADVCQECFEQHSSSISLRPVETRESKLRKLQSQNPDGSSLKHLIRTSRPITTGVICDSCGAECIEQHLLIQSQWLENDEARLTAAVCHACVSGQLSSLIKFAPVAARKPQTESVVTDSVSA